MNESEKWNDLKDQVQIGDEIDGIVCGTKPFGVFVDIGFQVVDGHKFAGIIDIALSPAQGVEALPLNKEEWPKIGEQVSCVVLAYRERSFEVDLGIKT